MRSASSLVASRYARDLVGSRQLGFQQHVDRYARAMLDKTVTALKADKAKTMTWGADTTPVAKVSFVTKVGDLICGVGYYK